MIDKREGGRPRARLLPEYEQYFTSLWRIRFRPIWTRRCGTQTNVRHGAVAPRVATPCYGRPTM